MREHARLLHLRHVRAFARLNERVDVDAGELQALEAFNEARELAKTAVGVRDVGVLKKGMQSRLRSHVRTPLTYSLMDVLADENHRTLRQR